MEEDAKPLLDIKLTVVVALLVASFLALGAWQTTRALSGNTLSWAYVFEWPLFAAYAVYIWWKLRRGEPPSRAGIGADSMLEKDTEAQDAALDAYNRYLAQLAQQDEEEGR